MKILNINRVIGYLLESHEINIPHYGLKCSAKYGTDDMPFVYTVEFWSKHAPVRIKADIVSVQIAEDAPMIWLDEQGKPLRNKDGAIMCTRTLNIMCPVLAWKDHKSIYYSGHDPLTVAQRIINYRLVPCRFESPKNFLVQPESDFGINVKKSNQIKKTTCVINGIECVLEEGPISLEDEVEIGIREDARRKEEEAFFELMRLKGLSGDD